MAFLHSKSPKVDLPQLDLFRVPGTQTSVLKSYYQEYHPTNTLADGVPAKFLASGSGKEMTDMLMTYLYLKVKITQKNGSRIDSYCNVGPCNNFMHTLISDVIIKLNGVTVSSFASDYAQSANIQNLVGFGPAAKNSHLQNQLFYKDTAGHMNDIGKAAVAANSSATPAITASNAVASKNTGFIARKAFT